MYIDYLNYKNVGPIKDLEIKFRKNEKGVPVPLILVGKNGSGKSMLLSNIVDSFYEIACKVYDNAAEVAGSGHQYFKELSPSQISLGQNYLVAYIRYEQDSSFFDYIFKSGTLNFSDYKSLLNNNSINGRLDWANESNFKNVTSADQQAIDSFEKDIVCYFGPNRYMKPSWMGTKYYRAEDTQTYSLRSKYSRKLNNPITAVNISDLTLQWLFDIITDSRADLEKNEKGYVITYPSVGILNLLSISRQNAEQIMSEILGENIIFRMGNRSSGKRRFSILRASDKVEIVPSLDSLSTGQLALFNLFATIIRYADSDNIDLSHRLNEIRGIVVIDEVELHLHTTLQRDILPRLISLFPKVQFIITSHSPLFLLGMQEQFGDEGFDIVEMPSGHIISVEQFSEFENAYRYFSETKRYHGEIEKAIQSNNQKALIVTEGATDWKHMKAAYNSLCNDPRCSSWLPNLSFDFLEYEPDNSSVSANLKLKMGEGALRELCKQSSHIPQNRKLIFIADCDVPNAVHTLNPPDQSSNGSQTLPYKCWGNNVYSFCLPVPSSRASTPGICIEHYYSDNEIKSSININGIPRRLFMGNEFDNNGISLSGNITTGDLYICKDKNSCGPDKISIIDASEKKKVVKVRETPEINYALPKMDFANYILEAKAPFDHMNFSNFIPLFETIKQILENT